MGTDASLFTGKLAPPEREASGDGTAIAMMSAIVTLGILTTKIQHVIK